MEQQNGPQSRGLNELRRTALAGYADEFSRFLFQRSHAASTVEVYLRAAAHFGRWLTETDETVDRLCEALIRKFLDGHLRTCRCKAPVIRSLKTQRAALNHLLVMLRATGVAAAMVDNVPRGVRHELDEFDGYLCETCGASTATRTSRNRYVRDFLVAKFGDGPIDRESIEPKDLSRFIFRRGRSCKPGKIGVIASSVRSYLRFCQLSGSQVDHLVHAVPSPARWRLATVPTGATDEQVRRFLSSLDRSKPRGLRDYAMALCLAELAMRAGEVASLRISDVDWRQGTLTIAAGKARVGSTLPLPVRFGCAMDDYIRRGRPKSEDDHIFVRHGFLEGQSIGPETVRSAVRLGYARAGLPTEWTGTHRLRHAAATRMVRNGASLKEVADVLRHRTLDTTAIYAKVDLPTLLAVALPWPTRRSS